MRCMECGMYFLWAANWGATLGIQQFQWKTEDNPEQQDRVSWGGDDKPKIEGLHKGLFGFLRGGEVFMVVGVWAWHLVGLFQEGGGEMEGGV